MNKLFLGICVAAGLSVSAVSFGQGAGPRGMGRPGMMGQGGRGPQAMLARRKEMYAKVYAQLGLNASQKSKLKALDASEEKKIQAMIKKAMANRPAPGTPPPAGRPGGPMAGMREEMMKMRKDRQDSLKKILTPAQMDKYRATMRAEQEKMRAQFGRRPGMGGPGGRPGGPR